jgi:hypothetical protein
MDALKASLKDGKRAAVADAKPAKKAQKAKPAASGRQDNRRAQGISFHPLNVTLAALER